MALAPDIAGFEIRLKKAFRIGLRSSAFQALFAEGGWI
jgi:hypothetical protein